MFTTEARPMHHLIAAILLAAGTAMAGDLPFPEAVQVFQRAQQGQDKEVAPAIAAFEALVRAEPRNPVYLAYLGGALSLKARSAQAPLDRMKYAEEGLDQLDRALAALGPEQEKAQLRGVPMGLEARLTAANTFLRLPDAIFHRRAQAKKLVAELQKHPALPGAPASIRTAVDAAAAEAAKP